MQLTDHMRLEKKEDQGVDASVLLRRGNKIITGDREKEGQDQMWEEMGEMYRGYTPSYITSCLQVLFGSLS